MASKVVGLCNEKICPIIEKLGYEVVEVEYQKKVDGMNLTFYIDKENGVTVDDCEKVNDAISDALDELDPTQGETYLLNISSPGLDRPIKNYKDFLRNKDKKVKITLYKQIDGIKNYIGLLKDYTENDVTVAVDDKLVVLKHSEIAQISPVIEF